VLPNDLGHAHPADHATRQEEYPGLGRKRLSDDPRRLPSPSGPTAFTKSLPVANGRPLRERCVLRARVLPLDGRLPPRTLLLTGESMSPGIRRKLRALARVSPLAVFLLGTLVLAG